MRKRAQGLLNPPLSEDGNQETPMTRGAPIKHVWNDEDYDETSNFFGAKEDLDGIGKGEGVLKVKSERIMRLLKIADTIGAEVGTLVGGPAGGLVGDVAGDAAYSIGETASGLAFQVGKALTVDIPKYTPMSPGDSAIRLINYLEPKTAQGLSGRIIALNDDIEQQTETSPALDDWMPAYLSAYGINVTPKSDISEVTRDILLRELKKRSYATIQYLKANPAVVTTSVGTSQENGDANGREFAEKVKSVMTGPQAKTPETAQRGTWDYYVSKTADGDKVKAAWETAKPGTSYMDFVAWYKSQHEVISGKSLAPEEVIAKLTGTTAPATGTTPAVATSPTTTTPTTPAVLTPDEILLTAKKLFSDILTKSKRIKGALGFKNFIARNHVRKLGGADKAAERAIDFAGGYDVLKSLANKEGSKDAEKHLVGLSELESKLVDTLLSIKGRDMKTASEERIDRLMKLSTLH